MDKIVGVLNAEPTLSGNLNSEPTLSGQLNYISYFSKTGDDGVTFFPYVDTEGNLSWTNNGDLDNPPTVNLRGDKGESGKNGTNGENGFSPIITIEEDTETIFTLRIQTATDIIITPNLKGSGGGTGGVSQEYVDEQIRLVREYIDDKIGILLTDINEINSTLVDHNERLNTNATNISNLQAEATAKWVLLNTIDNRSSQNANDIININNDIDNINSEIGNIGDMLDRINNEVI